MLVLLQKTAPAECRVVGEHCQTNILLNFNNMSRTHTLSPSSSAIRRISKSSTIFPECSNTSASASVTKSLYQSGAGLPGLEEDVAFPIKKKNNKEKEIIIKDEKSLHLKALNELQNCSLIIRFNWYEKS